MFGESFGMKALEARKRLLIAESDLNRAKMAEDLAVVKAGLHSYSGRVKSIGVIASSVAGIVAGLAALRSRKAKNEGKLSWMNMILKAAGLVSSIWLAIRAKDGSRRD